MISCTRIFTADTVYCIHTVVFLPRRRRRHRPGFDVEYFTSKRFDSHRRRSFRAGRDRLDFEHEFERVNNIVVM